MLGAASRITSNKIGAKSSMGMSFYLQSAEQVLFLLGHGGPLSHPPPLVSQNAVCYWKQHSQAKKIPVCSFLQRLLFFRTAPAPNLSNERRNLYSVLLSSDRNDSLSRIMICCGLMLYST